MLPYRRLPYTASLMTLMNLEGKTKKKGKIKDKDTLNTQGTTTTLIGELKSCEKYFENEMKRKKIKKYNLKSMP